MEICSFTVFPEYALVPKEGERVQGPLGNCLQDMGVSHTPRQEGGTSGCLKEGVKGLWVFREEEEDGIISFGVTELL